MLSRLPNLACRSVHLAEDFLDGDGRLSRVFSGLYLRMAMTGFLLGGFSHSTWVQKNPVTSVTCRLAM